MNNTELSIQTNTETNTNNMESVTSLSLLENSSTLTILTTFSEVPTIISSTSSLFTPSPSISPPKNENDNNVVPYIFVGLGSIVGILFLSFVGVGVVKSIKKHRKRQSVNEFINNSSWEYSHKY